MIQDASVNGEERASFASRRASAVLTSFRWRRRYVVAVVVLANFAWWQRLAVYRKGRCGKAGDVQL